ncbi:GMC oxidoreductase [Rubrivirga sp. IMCC43871]|uniref:GMC oxidoreductase n=1 Tax=Rubrivirga sp. IMCC43871 TaxID=3391575 RepID=UPI00398FF518
MQHSHGSTIAPLRVEPVQAGAETYDAIVIGSGMSGGWAAKELTEKGLKTLVLERGRNVEHGTDYVTEHRAPWETPFRGRGDRKHAEERQFRQKKAGPYNENTAHWYVDDVDHPYETEDDTPNEVLYVRGHHVGGRSIMWGRQTYRLSDMDFTANERDGRGTRWPIGYADIEPWYSYVERFVGISGESLGLEQLPDSEFIPAMPLTAVEKKVRQSIADEYGRTLTIGRCAILTQPHNGRAGCHYCGPCDRGCTAGAYFCSLSSTLPAAQATGNLTLRPDSIVHSLVYDETADRVTGVRVIDRLTKEEMVFNARLVFLNASAFGSAQILMNSKTPRFPDGLGNQSGLLGKGIMDHHFMVGASGEMPGFEDRYTYGNRPNGIYIPRFQNLPWDPATSRDFIRGYGYQGGSGRGGWGRGAGMPGIGVALKESLQEPGQWSFTMFPFGETLAYDDNRIELTDEVDQWGIPIPRIVGSIRDNEQRMRVAMKSDGAEMLEAAGAVNVNEWEAPYRLGEGIHEMGTARMSATPETGCVDEWNRVHEIPNLYVTDGAFMTSAGCQNPSLTYMAMTARAVDHAVKAVNNGDLRV